MQQDIFREGAEADDEDIIPANNPKQQLSAFFSKLKGTLKDTLTVRPRDKLKDKLKDTLHDQSGRQTRRTNRENKSGEQISGEQIEDTEFRRINHKNNSGEQIGRTNQGHRMNQQHKSRE